ADTVARRLAVGWAIGVAVSAASLTASFAWDLPTGATVVAAFGALLAVVGLLRGGVALLRRVRRDGPPALAGLFVGTGVVVAAAGLGLAAFPRADHVWLDALERTFPTLQTPFLRPFERRVAANARASIARDSTEVARLRALAGDAQWGRRD